MNTRKRRAIEPEVAAKQKEVTPEMPIDPKNKKSKHVHTSVYENFKQGDILFGLFAARGKVDDIITAKGFHHTIANNLNVLTVPLVIQESQTAEQLAELDPEKRAHFNSLLKHRDYLIRQPGKSIPQIDEPVISAAFRRACKLLIVNRDPARTSTAHLITNNIIWKNVCRKSSPADSVTGSEFRAAYRDHKKNGPNPHVFFYDENYKKMSQPPWEMPQYKKHWERYELARQQKAKLKVASQLEQKDEAPSCSPAATK